MATAANRRLDNLVHWPLVTILFLLLVYFYYLGWSLSLASPYGLGEEGSSMWASLALSENRNPYDFARLYSHPWQCVVYPPVYFSLVGWIFKITGAAFYPMRMFSMGAFVVSLVTGYRIFTLSGCSKLARIVGLLVFSSFWTIWSYSFKGRVDMLSLTFVLLAIQQYLVLARKPKDDNLFRLPRLIVIATLCLAAAFTKQAALVVVPAIAAALIIGRQWRLSLFFMGLSSFLLIVTAWLLNNATAGGFLNHMLFAAQAPFQWQALYKHLLWLGSNWLPFLLTPVSLFIVIAAYIRDGEQRQGPYRRHLSALALITTLFVLSSVLAFYSLGAEFANVDETMVTAFCCAWLLALAVDQTKRRFLFLIFISMAVSIYVISDLSERLNKAVIPMINAREIMRSVPFNKKLMLCEDCSVAIDLDAGPEFVDIATFLQTWRATPGLLEGPMSEIKNRINRKEYGALVLNSRDGCLLKPYYYWDQSVIEAVKNNYQPIGAFMDEGRMQDFYLPKISDQPAAYKRKRALDEQINP